MRYTAPLFLFLTAGIPCANAQNLVVKVGVYENAPKIFTNESGDPAGFFIDLIDHIAEREGWNLEFVHGTWPEGLDRLARGEIDLMPDVALTTEREEIYRFHNVPVMASWFQVYAREGSSIRTIVDLAGKRITVLERSVQQETFIQMVRDFGLEVTLIPLPDYAACFDMVGRGDADAAITNRFFGIMHAAEYGLEDTAIIFHPTNLYFAAPLEGRGRLLQIIDNHLSALKADSQSIYYRSLRRWTSDPVQFSLPRWIKIIGLAGGTALAVSIAGAVILKRQVNARTMELMKANRAMEARIQIRTAELAAAMERAQEADQLKSAFLATMSHELRTPLNSIIGFTGILLQQLAGPLNEEQEKQMRMVQSSARHLLALINDVLDISKIEAGQLNLSISTFEVRPSIERMVSLVQPLAEKKGLSLEMEIAEDVGTVTTDQRRLEQVLLNLLNNAVKFTDHGRITLLCQSRPGGYLIAVSDTGIGIPPEELPRLFHPFHQIDSGLARKHEGTGLGLSICHKIIGMMGGTIRVDSEAGKGSTFTISFPSRAGESQ